MTTRALHTVLRTALVPLLLVGAGASALAAPSHSTTHHGRSQAAPAAAAKDQKVDYAALGREFMEAHCGARASDAGCTVQDVLDADFVATRLGAFELNYPTADLDGAEHRGDYQALCLGLLDLERTWVSWLTAGSDAGADGLKDIATIRAWVAGWNLRDFAALQKERAPRFVADLFEAPDDVRLAEDRVRALFHDRSRMGLAMVEEGRIPVILAPTRNEFVHWLGFAGLVDPSTQGLYWGPGTHEWVQFWTGWSIVLALEYAPWSGFDPTFSKGKSMKEITKTGQVEHVCLQSCMALLRYCFDRDLDHVDNAVAMDLVIDFVGQLDTIDGEGQITRSGAQTAPYSKFVPGGNPNGGLLPALSAAPYDTVVRDQWRKGSGADHFLGPLRQGQKSGAKLAVKQKAPRAKDRLSHFELHSTDGKFVVNAPFFGPHASEQQYPPAEFLNDYKEFFRSYKSAFFWWLREKFDPKSPDESHARFARFLARLDELDFKEKSLSWLVADVYGLPLSGADDSTDSLEWRFLEFLKAGK